MLPTGIECRVVLNNNRVPLFHSTTSPADPEKNRGGIAYPFTAGWFELMEGTDQGSHVDCSDYHLDFVNPRSKVFITA